MAQILSSNGGLTDATGKPTWLRFLEPMGGEQREKAAAWYRDKYRPNYVDVFGTIVKHAIENENANFGIINMEPSVDCAGRLYFNEGAKVCTGLSFSEWEEKAISFAPDYCSDICTLSKLFLWYAYLIAINELTLEFVCKNSSGKGNYFNSPYASHELDASGVQKCGRVRIGVGNTEKLVRLEVEYLRVVGGRSYDPRYVACGGCYKSRGNVTPMAETFYDYRESLRNGTGVIAINKL